MFVLATIFSPLVPAPRVPTTLTAQSSVRKVSNRQRSTTSHRYIHWEHTISCVLYCWCDSNSHSLLSSFHNSRIHQFCFLHYFHISNVCSRERSTDMWADLHNIQRLLYCVLLCFHLSAKFCLSDDRANNIDFSRRSKNIAGAATNHAGKLTTSLNNNNRWENH